MKKTALNIANECKEQKEGNQTRSRIQKILSKYDDKWWKGNLKLPQRGTFSEYLATSLRFLWFSRLSAVVYFFQTFRIYPDGKCWLILYYNSCTTILSVYRYWHIIMSATYFAAKNHGQPIIGCCNIWIVRKLVALTCRRSRSLTGSLHLRIVVSLISDEDVT